MRYIGVISGVVAALALAATATAGPFEDRAQVTVSGAEYVLNGYIVKVEGDAYWIRKASGDVVRVAVTKGTHLICPTRPSSKEAKLEPTKPGFGFRIGDCPFIPGDTVKVEISDVGSASLIRFDAPPASETMNLGLPQGWEGYMPNGVLSFKPGPHYPVYTRDGHSIGHLAGSLTDTISGYEYGLIELDGNGQMMAVPRTEMRQEWPEPSKPRVALLINKSKLEEMHPPAYSAANLISIPELRDFWAKTVPPEPLAARDVDVAIDISEKAFQITKGGTARGFTLMAGMPTVIQLRNRDFVAHEFVSTMFRDVPFRISGNAIVVRTARASGVRIDPGQTVTLEFDAPVAKPDRYGATETIYDVFWCNVHGKEHGQKMRGELAIIETSGEIGGG